MSMRRSRRLARTVELFRQHRILTAHSIAQELRVSKRTVYRYIGYLVRQGYLIEGEAGVGYRLRIRHDPISGSPDDLGCVGRQ